MLNINQVYCMLSKTYWASHRTKEIVEDTINKSVCFGIYINKEQVGFARVITDESVVSYICDVVIDEEYRGKGLGKWLMQCVIEHPKVKNTVQYLSTADAHGLYEKFGFVRKEAMKRIP
jgi:GNAT superfamily N-acetyltransferase